MEKSRIYVSMENLDKLDKEELRRNSCEHERSFAIL